MLLYVAWGGRQYSQQVLRQGVTSILRLGRDGTTGGEAEPISPGHAEQTLKVGIHSLGYVANSREEVVEDFYPGYAETFTRIGKERGWPPTR